MSTSLNWAVRLPLRNSEARSRRVRTKSPLRHPRRVDPRVEPGRTPATAPILNLPRQGDLVHAALGPADTEHFFKFRINSDISLSITLESPDGVVGSQVIRSPDGGGGGINPADVLAMSSNLVTNPTSLTVTLTPGWYLVRVYNFFNDLDEYLLELSPTPRAGHSGP